MVKLRDYVLETRPLSGWLRRVHAPHRCKLQNLLKGSTVRAIGMVKDMLIVCVDGLKGFPQAIEAVFPQALVQLCIVHMVRASLSYVSWKERKQVAADLKPIYRGSGDEPGKLPGALG